MKKQYVTGIALLIGLTAIRMAWQSAMRLMRTAGCTQTPPHRMDIR